MIWFALSAGAAPSETCTIGVVDVKLLWKNHEQLVVSEAARAAAEIRAPTEAPDSLVMAFFSSKNIDNVDPTRFLVVAQGADGKELGRFKGEWRSPELPDSDERWSNYLGESVAGPQYPMKVYVVDSISTLRCIFTVEADGRAYRTVLPPI